MRRYLFLIMVSYIFFVPVYAFEIAFPQEKCITVSKDGIFFIGQVKKNEDLYINNQKIIPQQNNSFATTFPLEKGNNLFCIKSNLSKSECEYLVTYKENKPVISELYEFNIQNYKTNNDNVILRSSPYDRGINRLGYLPMGTELKINGVKNEFSRVFLNDKNNAWVMTKDIIPELKGESISGEYLGEGIKSDNDTLIYSYKFSKNLPYSLLFKENKLVLNVYNVENSDEFIFNREIGISIPYCYSSKMQNGEMSIVIPKMCLDKTKFKIILDAGHGGNENGAVGCFSDYEKDMNLRLALILKKELQKQGYNVFLTRNSDKFLSLNDRIKYSIEKSGVIFVSLHMNSVPENLNPNEYNGTVTYYYNDFSKNLAECVQQELSNSLSSKDNGVFQESYAVIRPTEYVGILVETLFIVNPEDTKIYRSRDYFKKASVGITKGISRYIEGILN